MLAWRIKYMMMAMTTVIVDAVPSDGTLLVFKAWVELPSDTCITNAEQPKIIILLIVRVALEIQVYHIPAAAYTLSNKFTFAHTYF